MKPLRNENIELTNMATSYPFFVQLARNNIHELIHKSTIPSICMEHTSIRIIMKIEAYAYESIFNEDTMAIQVMP